MRSKPFIEMSRIRLASAAWNCTGGCFRSRNSATCMTETAAKPTPALRSSRSGGRRPREPLQMLGGTSFEFVTV